MDLTPKPKGLLRRLFERARDEIERRSRAPMLPPQNAAESWEPPRAAPAVASASAGAPVRVVEPSANGQWGAAELELEARLVGPEQLEVRFAGGEAHFASTRQLLGKAGRPQLRVVSLSVEGLEIVRRVIDLPLSLPSSETRLAVPAGARLVVSVGLAADAQFVSTSHRSLRP